MKIVEIGFPREYAASAPAGTVDGPLVSGFDEVVVEFALLADVVVDVDGAGSCDGRSSNIGESSSSL